MHALQKVNWATVFNFTYRFAVIAGIFAILYLKTLFVTHENLITAIDPYRTLPPKIQELEHVSMTGIDYRKELAIWRIRKDEIDTRLLTLMEQQQYMMLRQQTILDRQQEQIFNATRSK